MKRAGRSGSAHDSCPWRRLLGTLQVDRGSVAAFLSHPYTFTELAGERTMFEGFRRVPAGSVVALAQRRARTVSTWDLAAATPDLSGITPEAATALFAHRFEAAVAERTRDGPVAAHLSGGMDSSSVACIAHDLLASGHRRLTTISVVYNDPSLRTSATTSCAVLDQGGPVDPIYLDGDSTLDYQWFDEGLPSHDEPYAALFRVASERSLVGAAREAGAATVLTGAGADDLLAGDRFYLADLLHEGRVGRALAEARRWSLADNVSLRVVLTAMRWRR